MSEAVNIWVVDEIRTNSRLIHISYPMVDIT